jgi:hypothetical protein
MNLLKRWLRNHQFREPRKWSNVELRKISACLSGSVVNVSAWRDCDKEGGTYQYDYFRASSSYWTTNWRADACGFQGDRENEIYLDLETDLPFDLRRRFDVVFNHTTLEHVFDVQKAFENLCEMSKDVVIVVVPFLQEQHGAYGDYWRFTPWCLKRLFERNGIPVAYISTNDGPTDSIYVFAVGARDASTRASLEGLPGNCAAFVEAMLIGQRFCERRTWFGKIITTALKRSGLVS